MTIPRRSQLAGLVIGWLLVPSAALAQCPTDAPAHDVPYSCPASAPYLDFVGVCTPTPNEYFCGSSCTVCFCGSSFSQRTPCAGSPDAGPYDRHAMDSDCGISPRAPRAGGRVAAMLAGLLLATWLRRRSVRTARLAPEARSCPAR